MPKEKTPTSKVGKTKMNSEVCPSCAAHPPGRGSGGGPRVPGQESQEQRGHQEEQGEGQDQGGRLEAGFKSHFEDLFTLVSLN